MKKYNIMAFGAHPDDIEVHCGGTLAKYSKLGHNVHIAIATDGSAGHHTLGKEEIVKIRHKEAEAAANVINAKFIWLGYEDEFLLNNRETRLAVINAIRECNPDVILTCDPYDYHPDHIMISRLIFDASFTATLPLVKTANKAIKKVPVVYYFNTSRAVNFLPDEYVDITEFMDMKIQMLSKHKSQLDFLLKYYKLDLIENIKIVNKFWGLQCGVKYSEAFRQLKVYPRVKSFRLLP